MAKVLEFQLQISPSSKHSGLISFRMDWLDHLAVQGTLKSLQLLSCVQLFYYPMDCNLSPAVCAGFEFTINTQGNLSPQNVRGQARQCLWSPLAESVPLQKKCPDCPS